MFIFQQTQISSKDDLQSLLSDLHKSKLVSDIMSQSSISKDPWVGRGKELVSYLGKLENLAKTKNLDVATFISKSISDPKLSSDDKIALGFFYSLTIDSKGYIYLTGPQRGEANEISFREHLNTAIQDDGAIEAAVFALKCKAWDAAKKFIDAKESFKETFSLEVNGPLTADKELLEKLFKENGWTVLSTKPNDQGGLNLDVSGSISTPNDSFGRGNITTGVQTPFTTLARPYILTERLSIPVRNPNTNSLPNLEAYARAYGNAIRQIGTIDFNEGTVSARSSITGTELKAFRDALSSGMSEWTTGAKTEIEKSLLSPAEFEKFQNYLMNGKFREASSLIDRNKQPRGENLYTALGTGLQDINVSVRPEEKLGLVSGYFSTKLYTTLTLRKGDLQSTLYVYALNDTSFLITNTLINATEVGGKLVFTGKNIFGAESKKSVKFDIGGTLGGAARYSLSSQTGRLSDLGQGTLVGRGNIGFDTYARIRDFTFNAGYAFDLMASKNESPRRFTETHLNLAFKQPKYMLELSSFFFDMKKPFEKGNYELGARGSYFFTPALTGSVSYSFPSNSAQIAIGLNF